MKMLNQTILVSGLLVTKNFAADLVRSDATAALGPDFFVDDAATGGTDNTSNEPGVFAAARNFLPLNDDEDGSLITITGFAFATSGTAGVNDATLLVVTLSYLGPDDVLNTADDVVIGSETVGYTHEGAGEYAVVFDNPMTALVQASAAQGRFLIQVAPQNDAMTGSVRFKVGPLAQETFNGPKFSVAGTTLAFDPSGVDTDGDGLADIVETNTGVFVSAADTGTNPAVNDTDGDNLLDGAEVFGDSVTGFTSNPLLMDSDSDGLDDDVEVLGSSNTLYGSEETDPTDEDSDDDSALDGEETLTMGTDPNAGGTDFDGLSDVQEDVDKDGVVDVDETSATDEDTDEDTDDDSLPDGWEVNNGLDAINTDDLLGDPDGDTLLNEDEYNGGVQSSNPNDADSDNDKLDDRFEYDSTGLTGFLNLNNRDSDGDGLSDGYEIANSLNPLADEDFDGDLVSDAREVLFYGTNPDDVNKVPGDGVNPAPLNLTPVVNFGPVVPRASLPIRPGVAAPESLATAIINEAVQGGADLTFGNGQTNFVTLYSNLFESAGTAVEITGLAWVVAAGGNATGDVVFEFYDPEAVDGDVDFDGVDCERMVGRASGTRTPSGSTGVSYLAFDEPVTFTSAGISLAVRILSAASLRIKAQNGISTGFRYSVSGNGIFAANNAVRLTLFGIPANEVEPISLVISGSGFEANGDFFIGVEGGVLGKVVTSSNNLSDEFTAVTTTNDGANRFTITAGDLDPGGLAQDFFRIEVAPE